MASPSDPKASRLEEEALRLARHGSLRAAGDVSRVLNAQHPQYAAGWRTTSTIALQMREPAAALEAIDHALALAPKDGRSLLQKAHCLRMLRRQAEALDTANTARQAANDDAVALDALGTFYSLSGEQRLALAAYDRALELAPRSAAILFNRATIRRFVGQLAAAEDDYDHVIAARPNDYEAYKNRSDLRTQSAERNHVAELVRLLAPGVTDWRGEVQLRFALAKEYEDLADYTNSWKHLDRGARLRRRHLQYDVERDVATVDWIIDAFPGAPAASSAGCSSEEPIFIVGLPRSGTTLVERILGSHSTVHSAGELNDFSQAIVDAAVGSTGSRNMPREELVARAATLDFAALGRDYLARTRPATGHTPHFTDKMPVNYLYCGIIHRAFPKAKIVHLTRHPLAVSYAMYKTLFSDGYPFSYDLNEIGRYYAAYRKLMGHWHATLPGVVYDLSYEQLVADQEGESRRLLEFCGLPWEDACLAFHLNRAPTTTASAAQVRHALYDSSREQWRHYATPLEALRSQLTAAGIAVPS
jgi:tetratricopeptide (TPR) repeat protein